MRLIILLCSICLLLDSPEAQFLVPVGKAQGGACCCGQFQEIFFPNLDFEAGPSPGPGTFITYGVGQNFGGWTVTLATIDHCDPLVGNLGAGNPNGATYLVDLHGSPGQGAISYDLFGLTPGNQYRIEFWTAQNGSGFSSDGHLKIANGAWLNVTWTVSVSGSVSWRKESYEFMAMGTSATMEFSSTGPLPFQGTLIDDIHIFECPGDSEKPEVINPPDDILVECDKDIPKIPILKVTDNCDPAPVTSVKFTTEFIDPCTKKITRTWEITDDCGNTTTEDQIIDVIDNNPPIFTKLPETKTFYCQQDITKEFNDWIKKNGNATATDACVTVTWRTDYDHLPEKTCDTVLVEFIAKDHCGNENSEFAYFIVRDTSVPRFLMKAENKNLVCVPNAKDSLRTWLANYGFSKVSADCDTVIRSSNFNGDSTRNPVSITFYAKDRCGNIDSSVAIFSYRSNSDTFRITNYSCSFLQNSFDTSSFIIDGCDSIVILEKIRLLPDSMYFQLNTCDTNQDFDTLRYLNVNGCDSTIFNEYVFHKTEITTIQKKDCAYVFYTKDTVVLQGTYCDSFLITEYIPLQKSYTSIFQTTCDSTQTDTLILTLVNNAGCDSIITTFINYSPQKITFIEEKICGLQDEYTDTLTFSSGFCDSLVIRLHTPLPLDTTRVQSFTCDKSKAGIFSTSKSNQFGCDSLIIEEVNLNPSNSVSISKSTCTLSQAGTQTQNLKNSYGCDSIVTIVTTFIASDTSYIQRITCDVLQQRIDTLIYTPGLCDSMVIIDYVFLPSDTIYIRENTCNLFDERTDTIIYAGTFCDSIVFKEYVFVSSDTIHITQTSCDLAKTGMDTFFLQNAQGCDSIILIQTNYVPIHLEYTLDSISCFDRDDGVFRILNPNDFGSPFEIILNNKPFGSHNQISNLKPGSYEIYVRDQKGCITDSIQFELQNPDDLIIDLGNNHEVKKGTTIILNLQSNKTLQNIFWNPFHLTNCITCNQISLIADEDIWIYTQAIDLQGCNDLDSVFIRVKKETNLYVPNSFTPNGDNINDHFFILGDENAIVETLFIYDRWGNKIFETFNIPVNHPSSGWDGTFQSQKMNPGVFVYYAKVRMSDDELIDLKGDLTLIR